MNENMREAANTLLDRFLDVASGERTAETRAKYAATLDLLRATPATGGEHETAARWLVARVGDAVAGLDTQGLEAEVRRAAPGLWERLMRWLVRNTDAGAQDARCLVLATNVALRQVMARDSSARYQATSWRWPEPLMPERDWPDDVEVRDGRVIPLRPDWM